MSECKNDGSYTINIIEDRTNKTAYKDVTDKVPFTNHCNKLGWPNDVLDKQASFINGPMKDTTGKCFTSNIHHIEFTEGGHTCYLNRRCEKGKDGKMNKEIDYTCYSSYIDTTGDKPKDKTTLICDSTTLTPNVDNTLGVTGQGKGYARCKQGYIAEPVIMSNATPSAWGGWNCKGKWSYGGEDDEWTGKCIPDSCPDITIHDSKEYSFSPVHGKYNDKRKLVECNDGYSFNHDLLHKGGYIKCDYDLIGGDLWNKNKMSWYVNDDRLEEKCNVFNSKDTCEGNPPTVPIPSYNPYDVINLPNLIKSNLFNIEQDTMDMKEIPIGCKWSSELTTSKGNGNEISKPGKCHYRVKVDPNNNHEPICKPKYCPEKSIPNSDRSNMGKNTPLPGPKNRLKDHGECINSVDGTIYPITNPQDCLCYKYNACKTCNTDVGCQWCGGKSGSGKGGCYSIKTSEPICNEDVVGLEGQGTCITRNVNPSSKPDWDKLR